jgi:hypothetical protein
MDARLKTPEDPRPLTREECIVETVLGIIGGATVIEDGIERHIGPHDIHGVLYHLREACLTTQRVRARQSKQAMRAIKQLSTALRRANQPKGGLPEDIRLVLGLDRMIHHLAAYGKAHRKPKPDAIRKRLAADYAIRFVRTVWREDHDRPDGHVLPGGGRFVRRPGRRSAVSLHEGN